MTSPRLEPHRHDRWHLLEVIKDNVEAFTIALVLALTIKHFCVEAFKIPTDSMKPTLLGDTSTSDGDRILVDKWAYLRKDPERWDVMVFRYPLNRSKHFIKRVASPGDEWIRIHEGDLWVRRSPQEPWRIATKRRRARDELYVPVWPPPEGSVTDLDRVFGAGVGWAVQGADAFAFGGAAVGTLEFTRQIGSYGRAWDTSSGVSGTPVTDVRVRLAVRVQRGAALSIAWQTESGEETRLRLATATAPQPSLLTIHRPAFEVTRPLGRSLEEDRWTSVEFEAVDGEAIVSLDGAEVARLPSQRPLEHATRFTGARQRLAMEADGAAVEVRDFRVDRDLWYEPHGLNLDRMGEEGTHVPAGQLFVLGDNTTSSSDSRKWKRRCARIPGREEPLCWDGTGSSSSAEERPLVYVQGGDVIVTDVEGLKHRLPSSAIHDGWDEPSPFVDRSLVVGRAFLVFWPVSPAFPGRLRFIH